MEFELGEYIRLYNIEKGESLISPLRMLYRIYNRCAKLVFTKDMTCYHALCILCPCVVKQALTGHFFGLG